LTSIASDWVIRSLNLKQMTSKTWSCVEVPVVVLARFVSSGFKVIGQAGSGVGFSGKARYSADVAVSDYRYLFPPSSFDHDPN
jgi:hypothetical protein